MLFEINSDETLTLDEVITRYGKPNHLGPWFKQELINLPVGHSVKFEEGETGEGNPSIHKIS